MFNTDFAILINGEFKFCGLKSNVKMIQNLKYLMYIYTLELPIKFITRLLVLALWKWGFFITSIGLS